jgi:5-methylcytosine-specific restriction endonuclease McrA
MAVDPHIRVALFEAYSEICQWCKHPLVFADMQIDHIFPENSTPEKLAEMIEMHGQPSDFDVHATYNLVPTCGPANRHKSDRIPPVAPIITFMLETARKKAPSSRQGPAGLRVETCSTSKPPSSSGIPTSAG